MDLLAFLPGSDKKRGGRENEKWHEGAAGGRPECNFEERNGNIVVRLKDREAAGQEGECR